jgi:uncharacterized RDD family membrane protein YckC
MENANPYQPPEASLAVEHDPSVVELATRGQRLGAALLDMLIGLAFGVPMMYAAGFFDYIGRGQKPPFGLTLLLTASGFVIFILVHGYFLKRDGQTIGKKLVGTRIATLDDGVPSFPTLIGARYFPLTCLSLIPSIGQILSLIDSLFVFRSDRRCVHDLIAGTKVVKVSKK